MDIFFLVRQSWLVGVGGGGKKKRDFLNFPAHFPAIQTTMAPKSDSAEGTYHLSLSHFSIPLSKPKISFSFKLAAIVLNFVNEVISIINPSQSRASQLTSPDTPSQTFYFYFLFFISKIGR